MNAIEEAIAKVKEWQARDPETRFLDGHSMSGGFGVANRGRDKSRCGRSGW